MSSPTPFTLSGSLDFAPDTGVPIAKVPFSGSNNFLSKADVVLNLTGAGSKVVSFGTIPAEGAKGILVEVDPDGTGLLAPVMLAINGSATGKLELSPGGFCSFFNPNPLAGIAAITVEHTTANVVRVWLLGG